MSLGPLVTILKQITCRRHFIVGSTPTCWLNTATLPPAPTAQCSDISCPHRITKPQFGASIQRSFQNQYGRGVKFINPLIHGFGHDFWFCLPGSLYKWLQFQHTSIGSPANLSTSAFHSPSLSDGVIALPIMVVARSMVCVCGRSVAVISGSYTPPGRGCLSVMSVVCCQVEVSASGWSLAQGSPT